LSRKVGELIVNRHRHRYSATRAAQERAIQLAHREFPESVSVDGKLPTSPAYHVCPADQGFTVGNQPFSKSSQRRAKDGLRESLP